VQANQPNDFLIRDYNIDIVVYNLEEALEVLNNLPGFVLNSRIDVRSGWGHMDRMISNIDMERAMADLHGMGRVVHSSSASRNVFALVSDLQSSFQVRSAEYDRLMELLHEADTMANFTNIENRLVQVIENMEDIRSRQDQLAFETATARIRIGLSAAAPEAEDEPEYGAIQRIGNAFVSSAGITFAVLQWILIVLAYVSIPLGFFIIVGIGVVWIVLRRNRVREDAAKNEINKDDLAEGGL